MDVGRTSLLLLRVHRYFEVVEVPSDGQPRMRVSENSVVEVWAEHDLASTRSATRHSPISSTEHNNTIYYMGHRPYCWAE